MISKIQNNHDVLEITFENSQIINTCWKLFSHPCHADFGEYSIGANHDYNKFAKTIVNFVGSHFASSLFTIELLQV